MEEIKHGMVGVNGIRMHIAEKGEGPVVLFLHGFPELWYTWRRQILALSSLGYRAIAPDLRGYGDTEAPSSISSYSCHHIVGDLVALINSLGVEQVFVVAHDWGAIIAWYLCLFCPERVKAFVCLSVPFLPRNPNIKPVESMRALFGDDYCICRFQIQCSAELVLSIGSMEPGKIEAQIAQVGTAEVLKNILANRKPGPSCFPEENAFGIDPENRVTLPSWFSEQDLSFYATKFNQRGFTGALNYYRAMNLNWEMTAAWTEVQVKVPVKFIVGELDMVYTTPGIKEYVHNGGFKKDVPLLEEIVVIEDAVWYAWRHQILALSCLGYSVVAPDLRGYGDTEVPSSSFTSYTCFHVAGDIIALIDFLGVEQVFVVAHDFGAIIAWHLCLFRPERVKSFVSLGMPYLPRDPNLKPVETLRAMYGDNFYICKFQEPGVLEAGIAHIGSKLMLASSLTTRRPGPRIISENAAAHLARETINLPSWLSEEEFNYYVTKFDQT
ncbi:AB hydrolase-1 domain-containing protein [Citrus sinensis]|nr:AB hydrolase-1 domain-containing protein [Citrus sinensis]